MPRDLRSWSLPKRTWNGEQDRSPLSSWMTIMSIAPESVAVLKS